VSVLKFVSGRKVLITGSAGFLGRALRKAFEAQGDEVFGVDCEEGDGVDKVCNLNDPIIFTCPPVDIVICNASTEHHGGHSNIVETAATYKRLKSVVWISSIYGVVGSDPWLYRGTTIRQTRSDYAESKGAMIALTKHFATTIAPVRVNCVAPGGIYRKHSKQFVKKYSSKVPLGRMATEDDIVGPVLFLCSDAARYITGQVLMVDGGYSSW
jgi:NAD(P)-dependent dehydrogenase (short-subunit alcohol dehydrogenase family)